MEWISVKDRLPEYGKWVIVFEGHDDKEMHVGRLDGEFSRDFEIGARPHDCEVSFSSYDITHWMPLPEASNKLEEPKEK